MVARRLRDLAVAALVALGLLGVAAALAGSARLAGLSRVLMASPLPLVFSRQGNVELTARRFELEVELDDGTRRIERQGPELRARLRGPFTAVASYAGILSAFPEVHEPRRTALLRRAVCDGPIAAALALEAPVRIFAVRTWSARGTDEPEQEIVVACEP
jgi:hypothetical protein